MDGWLKCAGWICLALGACGPRLASSTPQPESPPEQAFSEALRTMCEVDERAKVAEDADPVERAGQRNDYLSDHVKNPDAIEFRTLLFVRSPAEQAKALRERARAEGVTRCALADSLEKEG